MVIAHTQILNDSLGANTDYHRYYKQVLWENLNWTYIFNENKDARSVRGVCTNAWYISVSENCVWVMSKTMNTKWAPTLHKFEFIVVLNLPPNFNYFFNLIHKNIVKSQSFKCLFHIFHVFRLNFFLLVYHSSNRDFNSSGEIKWKMEHWLPHKWLISNSSSSYIANDVFAAHSLKVHIEF